MNWNPDRVAELEGLRELLNNLKGLNKGSDFLGQVEDCIKKAEEFTKFDLNISRDSFIDFLYKICREDWTPGCTKKGDVK